MQLSERVIADTKVHTSIHDNLQNLFGTPSAEIVDFRKHFQASGLNSVDAFLERRPEYMQIGKRATAFVLIQEENPDRLFGFKDNWLRILNGRMATDYEQFKKNNVAFITFNYDRNVEHFFFEAISSAYDKPPEEVKELMRERLPIIHLHGRLGYLPWEGASKVDTLPYQASITPVTLSTAENNIKIIHEDIGGRDADFSEAKRLIAAADRIVLMGFGYNETNIARLGIRDLPAGKVAVSTAVGIPTVPLEAAKKATNLKINFYFQDCATLLNEVVGWP